MLMKMTKKIASLIIPLWVLASSPLFAQSDKDMAGSRDHPDIPRIERTVIYGYEYSDYDEGTFLAKEDGKYYSLRAASI